MSWDEFFPFKKDRLTKEKQKETHDDIPNQEYWKPSRVTPPPLPPVRNNTTTVFSSIQITDAAMNTEEDIPEYDENNYPKCTDLKRKIYRRDCDHGMWFWVDSKGRFLADLEEYNQCKQLHSTKVQVHINPANAQIIYAWLSADRHYFWADESGMKLKLVGKPLSCVKCTKRHVGE